MKVRLTKGFYVNPCTGLVSTVPNCARKSVSASKLGQAEFGIDHLKDIAREVFPR